MDAGLFQQIVTDAVDTLAKEQPTHELVFGAYCVERSTDSERGLESVDERETYMEEVNHVLNEEWVFEFERLTREDLQAVSKNTVTWADFLFHHPNAFKFDDDNNLDDTHRICLEADPSLSKEALEHKQSQRGYDIPMEELHIIVLQWDKSTPNRTETFVSNVCDYVRDRMV